MAYLSIQTSQNLPSVKVVGSGPLGDYSLTMPVNSEEGIVLGLRPIFGRCRSARGGSADSGFIWLMAEPGFTAFQRLVPETNDCLPVVLACG